MKKKREWDKKIFKLLGMIPLLTTLLFYVLIARVYFWNDSVLPFWKHPLKSTIPFTFHNQLILFFKILTDFIAIPACFFLLIYLGLSNPKWINKQKKLILLVVIGVVLYDGFKFIDPYGLFDWWLD